MARTSHRAAGGISFLALIIVGAAIVLAPSTQASGATHAKANHRATHAKASHRCGSHAARRGRKSKHSPSVRGHASRKRQHHRNPTRCVHAARKQVTHKKTKTTTAPSVPANPRGPSPTPGVPQPQTTWTPVGTPPLSDAEAAAKITPEPEVRPENEAPNDFVPGASELNAFHAAEYGGSEGELHTNPLDAYVDGLDGLTKPSTGDLIQWAAQKWGIPEEWLMAEYYIESDWHQNHNSDEAEVPCAWYDEYPPQARISDSGGVCKVYQSIGITQIKWEQDLVGPGTEPLRWKSTAFNVDYQAAQVRYYFDGYCSWCVYEGGYKAGDEWNSIGAWYLPGGAGYPWGSANQEEYVGWVKEALAAKPWRQPGF
jgi:hypothetical protein